MQQASDEQDSNREQQQVEDGRSSHEVIEPMAPILTIFQQ
jgi:hypothetical protein